MKCVAIIPAKGTSRRIPNKNRKLFFGKPIISYSVEAARTSGLFDEIWISTDDPEIEDAAAVAGVSFSWRDAHLCADDVGTQEVTKATLERLKELGASFDYACCIYPCAPMMTATDLTIGLDCLLSRWGWENYAYTPGWFYWGTAKAFLDGVPLDQDGDIIPSERRYIDINTPEDWAKAEEMYKALHPEVA